MKNFERVGFTVFGCIEIIIGLVTIASLLVAKVFFDAAKPLPVFLFVFSSAAVSSVLGIGILRYRLLARNLLMFFAGYIVLTKILIFCGLIILPPPFETLIPPSVKNIISLFYHVAIIAFFGSEKMRSYFK